LGQNCSGGAPNLLSLNPQRILVKPQFATGSTVCQQRQSA
jgi:hypothetical protein